MKVESIKQLEQVIKLCRKTGVNSIEIDGVKLMLGEAPAKPGVAETKVADETPAYTEEDYLLWSSQPQVS